MARDVIAADIGREVMMVRKAGVGVGISGEAGSLLVDEEKAWVVVALVESAVASDGREEIAMVVGDRTTAEEDVYLSESVVSFFRMY